MVNEPLTLTGQYHQRFQPHHLTLWYRCPFYRCLRPVLEAKLP
jgi:hypothetical protein